MLLQDIRYAIRQLRLAPLFALTAIFTLALGIGANTAIFTLAHAVLLRSLPVASPNALYRVGDTDDCCVNGGFVGDNGDFDLFSYSLYQYLQQAAPEFTQLAAMQAGFGPVPVRRGTAFAASLPMELVSGNYFSTLGVRAFAGRMLTPDDDRPGAPPVAVVSYDSWQNDFSSDRGLIGQTVDIHSQPMTIVGIAPSGFYGDRVAARPPHFWLPLAARPAVSGEPLNQSLLSLPDAHWLYLIGRLRPEANPAVVQTKLSVALRQWLSSRSRYTDNGGAALIPKQHVVVVSAARGIQNLQQETGQGLKLLLWLAAVVLLIACANIANMLLARGTARRKDVALRMALGESRRRLLRRVITESAVLGCAGGLAGLLVAYLGARTIIALAFPQAVDMPVAASPDWVVLAFAFAVSLLTGVLFGLAPAWAALHTQPADVLRGVGRSTGGGDRASISQSALVVFQIALSLVLITGALLTSRSLANLQNQSYGLDTAHRYVLHYDVAGAGYTVPKLDALYRSLETSFSSLPGVAHVGMGMYSPLEGDNWGECVIQEGHSQPGPNQPCGSSWIRVTPGYLASIGVPMVSGRDFNQEDTATSPQVALVNQAFVKKFYPGENPIGRRFGLNEVQYSSAFTIVGVFRDFQWQNPRGAVRALFLRPATQHYAYQGASMKQVEDASMFLNAMVIDFDHVPPSPATLLRRTLRSVDPNLIVGDLRTFSDQVAHNFDQDRLLAGLSGLFAVLALLLASVGLYGVTVYLVACRTSEIGVRSALGASRWQIISLILRRVGWQTGLGLAVGIPAALGGVRLLGSQVYGVSGYDPRYLAAAALVLVVCAALAGFLPARRAAAIDPARTLRAD